MSENIHSFLQFIQHEKRYSPNTLLAYGKDIAQFEQFASNTFQCSNIDFVSHIEIRSWVVSLMEGKMLARSINRKISTLKSYFKFLMRKGVIQKNPMVKVISPKSAKQLPVFIEQKGMQTLLTDVEFGDDFEGKRARLILELLYATGMRRSELLNVKDKDIDRYGGQIKVIGKGKKERIVPLNNALLNVISLFQDCKRECNTASEYLLCEKDGKQMSPSKVYAIVTKYLTMVTTVAKRSPHVLRHSFATHLLNNGAEINAVKELLGHSNLAATQVYTHNTIDKLKDVYRKAYPKGE